jgi:brefeldin A-inhibited guanine nucleotide-exchange protein
MEGYANFSNDGFEKHIETFYPLLVDLLNRDLGLDVRMALQVLLRRIGEIKMGMPPMQTPTSPTSTMSYQFGSRRSSRVK